MPETAKLPILASRLRVSIDSLFDLSGLPTVSGIVEHKIAEPTSDYSPLGSDARWLALAWQGLSPTLQRHYRQLIFRDRAIEKMLPYFAITNPDSPNYAHFIASVEKDWDTIKQQLKLDLE